MDEEKEATVDYVPLFTHDEETIEILVDDKIATGG